jgi:aspartyl-tRNA(Asn)/glutamyl-tRNA(Gln) amidotransferase subunit B
MTDTKVKYEPVIGLEIHAELKTKTKMFSNSKNDPDETRPNVNINPVDVGHPGTLPTINKKAIESMIKIGLSVGGTIADFTEFDRKNYFYPDIPKGYQISQFEYPIVSGGKINDVELTRIHLEEDTGLSKHDRGDYSLVDFNRAGIPLMELVTEPVIKSSDQAVTFAKTLRQLLRTLGVADANMEKGEMRVEANISVREVGQEKFGTKVEVKNLNSFKSVERAIEFEIKRMTELLDAGKGDEIIQETRGWDENKQKTFSQRIKETSDDYRYFPEPDLPKMKLHEVFDLDSIKSELPELPWEKKDRLVKEVGIKEEAAEIFVADETLGKFFDEVIKDNSDSEFIKLASNYITSDVVANLKTDTNMPEADSFVSLVSMIKDGDVSSRGAKDILLILMTDGGDPKQIAEDKGLLQESDEGALEEIVKAILDNNEKAVEEYKAGKEASLQFLIGQGMKETKGSANPQVLKEIFTRLLS